MIGVISQQAIDKGIGTSIYLDDKGFKQEVSAVYATIEEAERMFKWPDAMVVSENLVEWISNGIPTKDDDAL